MVSLLQGTIVHCRKRLLNYAIINTNKTVPYYEVDSYMRKRGYDIVRSLPYHCDIVKGDVGKVH